MNELLFFLFGLVTGGFIGMMIMCMLQIKRINDYEFIMNERENEVESECQEKK